MRPLTDQEIEKTGLIDQLYHDLTVEFPNSKFDDRIAKAYELARQQLTYLDYVILEAEGKLKK
jgi:hypothetical protein